ncbi:MAG: hypothetical protein AAF587_14400 [Bacteroidota bacterium]
MRLFWILIILASWVMSCSPLNSTDGDPCADKDIIIQALQAEKNRYEKFLRNGNATLQQISMILDSIDQQTKGISELARKEGVRQPEIIDRIREAKDYISAKEAEIQDLKDKIARDAPNNKQVEALYTTIFGLEKQIKEKEQHIDELNIQLTTLTEDFVVLKEDYQDKERALDSTKLIAEESMEEIKLLEEQRINLEAQLKNQADLAKLAAEEKAQAYFDVGLAYEREGDEYKRRKKRNEKYEKALENYRLAHQSGMEEASRAINRTNYKIK